MLPDSGNIGQMFSLQSVPSLQNEFCKVCYVSVCLRAHSGLLESSLSVSSLSLCSSPSQQNTCRVAITKSLLENTSRLGST